MRMHGSANADDHYIDEYRAIYAKMRIEQKRECVKDE